MSILNKPYEISVWDDVWNGEKFVETRLGIIGSDKMESQSRALEPTLTRNVNGTKKLSFKMYKHYKDIITGEEVENPFIDWLISERKVKLEYNGKWYDFIIKNINESSTNYLYTYQLEDALVQELSKNGFGTTLDAKLMNNTGDAEKLATYVLAETDWEVESEVFVEKVDEALIYITIPAGTHAFHIIDQSENNLDVGITTQEYTFSSSVTALAFYSSCKNRPRRFQFIYHDVLKEDGTRDSNNYGKKADGTYKINRKDNRTIDETDCQYYIDFDYPEDVYESTDANGAKVYDLYLPNGFAIATPAYRENNPTTSENESLETDTVISSWYRGARYGFAQEAIYVPILDKYCQKFTRNGSIELSNSGDSKNIDLHVEEGGGVSWNNFQTISGKTSFSGIKNKSYAGYKFLLNYDAAHTYTVEYSLKVTSGSLKTIGGHKESFVVNYHVYDDSGNEIKGIFSKGDSVYTFEDPIGPGTTIKVIAKYNKIINENDKHPYIFIQPNRSLSDSVGFDITNLTISYDENYLGYVDSKYISPTIIQNYITNYNFEGSGGWTATFPTTDVPSSSNKPEVECVYGRFDNTKGFQSIVNDFLNATYSETTTYTPYLKMKFIDNTQFVLNSSIKDNRTLIENISEGEEWVLDYKIVNETNELANDKFSFFIKEFEYDHKSGGYNERTDYITFIEKASLDEEEQKDIPANCTRKVFTVSDSSYLIDSFKKKSKVYLQIKPSDANTYYIEKISLYKKSIGAEGKIIIPDYEENQSEAAENYIDNSTIEKQYHYFSEWLTNKDNPNAVTEKDKLPTLVRTSLDYGIYKPVYNEDARKIRSVTAKESNYFNILQNIAETFEAWLLLELERDTLGAITRKVAKFKNYVGADNYANFRYGVNLKDIQRTYDSKNIVTKLIVKQNTNELAENGFCTIQRAGANPTGENYIYDFQYYQNAGIIDVNDYLTTNYYLVGAKGPDAELWEDDSQVQNDDEYNLKGYFPRIKKINDALVPINNRIIGLNTDLVQKKAELEVAEATYEAALSGVEETKEDFHTLTGVYPEEAQSGNIHWVSAPNAEDGQAFVTQDAWYTSNVIFPAKSTGGSDVTITITASSADKELYPKLEPTTNATLEDTTSKTAKRLTTNTEYGGLCLVTSYVSGEEYILTYEIESVNGTLENIGCHNASFSNFSIEVTDTLGTKIEGTLSNSGAIFGANFENNKKYLVTIRGTSSVTNKEESFDTQSCLWIQPNRQSTTEVTCIISSVHLYQKDGISPLKNKDRTAYFYLNTNVYLTKEAADAEKADVARTYSLKCVLPANELSVTKTYTVTAVDTDRTDVQGYIEKYTTFKSELNRSSVQKVSLKESITKKEQEIKTEEQSQKRYLEHKAELNKLFFTKYSRFIQEGTWISEEYVDDEKYYADALSVMYNSCYPQVAYNINVVSLKGLPGYELIDFDLGDKTYAIDEKFFGHNGKEEVIITETVEKLDSPKDNQIKVQNFKNQFQDLFQKITATVQQTQYNVGSYERGSAFLDASIQKQSDFITNAINSATSYLSYGQTVESGASGITITDNSNRRNQLRLVGGAILFSTEDPRTKEQTWMTGITNTGISANLITAGQLDVGTIQIMAGNEPAFKWDAYGISAYDTIWDKINGVSTVSGVNTKKFVRFDKHGIYGVDNDLNGSNWHPRDIEDIKNNASYYLTWDGLSVTPENLLFSNDGNLLLPTSPSKYSVKLGRVDDFIFNRWQSNGIPTYDTEKLDNETEEQFKTRKKFVKVMAVGDKIVNSPNEVFVLYSDGTLVAEKIKLTGDIEWTDASSPSKNIYGKIGYSKPGNNINYGDFEEVDSENWHQTYDPENDTHYCHTDNGGATWQGPFLVTGKSIVDTEIGYLVAEAGLTTEQLNEKPDSEWLDSQDDINITAADQCMYIRIRELYNDGSYSAYRYLFGASTVVDLTLSADTLVVQEDQNGVLTPSQIYLTAIKQNLVSGLKYEWYIGNSSEQAFDSDGKYSIETSKMDWENDTLNIRVKYAEVEDSITIIKVKEGSDAISVVLTNPTMVFNTSETFAEETCNVLVYRGATPLSYVSPPTSEQKINDWCYSLSTTSDNITIDDNGTIKVTNPSVSGQITFTLTLYKGSNEIASIEEKNLSINCSVINNGVHGGLTSVVYVYKATSENEKPDKPAIDANGLVGWSETIPEHTDENKYVWRSSGTKTITYTNSEGTESYETYNESWTTPELYSAYLGEDSGVDPLKHATYLTLFDNNSLQGVQYADGKLYINADYINTGTLTITEDGKEPGADADNIIFSAGWQSKIEEDGTVKKEGVVNIAGWTVTSNSLYTANAPLGDNGSCHIYPSGKFESDSKFGQTEKTWALGIGSNFGVTTNGELYCTSGNFTGVINANVGGSIGGWSINSTSLTSGDVGLYSADQISDSEVGNSGLIRTWRLKAGENFGVTSDGELYCTAGKIGNVTIGDIENGLIKRNLALNSRGPFTLIPQQTDSEGKIYTVKHFELAKTLKANTTYMISFDMKEKDIAIDNYKIGLYYYTTEGSIREEAAPMQTSGKNETNGKKIHKITTHNTVPENSYRCVLAIYAYKREIAPVEDQSVTFEEIKLEEGESATPWCPAEEDAMQSNVSNDFSWKFSPTEGMFMWDGAQGNATLQDDNLIFGIAKTDSNYQLKIKGEILAESGYIGELEIKDGALVGEGEGGLSISKDVISLGGMVIQKTTLNGIQSTYILAEAGMSGLILADSGGETYLQLASKDELEEYKYTFSVSKYEAFNGLPISITINKNPKRAFTKWFNWHKWSEGAIGVPENTKGRLQVFFKPGTTKYNFIVPNSAFQHDPLLKDYVGVGLDYASAEGMARSRTHNADEDWSEVLTAIQDFSGNTITVKGNLIPTGHGYNLGDGNHKWNGYFNELYCSNGYPDSSGSDERIKNSIETLPIEYEHFFDGLLPKRYKYNNGTSNRYHTGFIAQDVVQALNNSDITTQEFAGVMLNKPGQEDECWYLRRDEFVALNTWQIQKLKPRVSALEQTILNYESRISALETEIQNLKSI